MAAPKVSLYIEGKEFANWSRFSITFSLDSYTVVSFDAPFEPSRSEFRETFRPFSYKEITVEIDGVLKFTGYLMHVRPESSPERRRVIVEAYTKPGVLSDCHSPEGVFSTLEMRKLKLSEIAGKICQPYSVDVVVEGDELGTFDKVKCEEDQTVHEFLAPLAKQRLFVMNDTPDGKLRFWRAEAGAPVATLEEGLPPLGRVTPEFNPQEHYSQITAITDAKRGRKGAKHTIRNPLFIDPLRAFNFRVTDAEPSEAPGAAGSKLSSMYANIVKYKIELPTWRLPPGDEGSDLYDVNQTIKVKAPSAMIYDYYDLLTSQITLTQEEDRHSMSAVLSLPGSWSFTFPEKYPWGE